MLYQYNFYDHLVAGAPGASVKDRSAGNVFRYNWIVASEGHAIQIPESQGGLGYIDQLPSYRQTYIYGNVIYNGKVGASRIIRYGGDQGIYSSYRQGTLYFYNNTVINEGDKYSVPGALRWSTSLFLLPDSGEVGQVTIKETVDCRNNIIYNQASTLGALPSTLELMSTDLTGTINMTNNWVSPNTIDMHAYYNIPINLGKVNHVNTFLGNNGVNNPNFNNYATQDYTLSAQSNAINKGTVLIGGALNYPVLEEYVKPLTSKPRVVVGPIDLGAYENIFVAPTSVSGINLTPASISLGMGQTASLLATVLPANASNKNIVFSSNNTGVATVSPLGIVTGVSGGAAIITVTTQDGNYTATSQISVKQTVVGWNFNNKTAKASSGIPVNLNQNITREVGYLGVFDYNVAGISGASTDWSLSSTNWDNGANAKYWIVNFATTGYYSLLFSSAQRANGYGPQDFILQYRVGNTGAWANLVTVKDSIDWVKGVVSNLALPKTCENQALVQIRWLSVSNNTPANIPIQSVGSGRIDEITIVGDNTPPIAILGLVQKNSTKASAAVALYPNPTYSEINVSVNFDTPSSLHFNLLDVSGRVLKEFNSYNSALHHDLLMDLSAFAEGIYFIQVDSKEERIVHKFVKIQ